MDRGRVEKGQRQKEVRNGEEKVRNKCKRQGYIEDCTRRKSGRGVRSVKRKELRSVAYDTAEKRVKGAKKGKRLG